MNKKELIKYLNENSTGRVAGRKEIRGNDIFISSSNDHKHFRLTRFGKDLVEKHFKSYKIVLGSEKKIETGNDLLTLDKYMLTPYYLSRGTLLIYEESVAAELLLLDSDLNQWVTNKKFYG
jgi:hypothetical protein